MFQRQYKWFHTGAWLDLTVLVLLVGDEWKSRLKASEKWVVGICWYSGRNVLKALSRAEWTEANLWYGLADNMNCLSVIKAKNSNILCQILCHPSEQTQQHHHRLRASFSIWQHNHRYFKPCLVYHCRSVYLIKNQTPNPFSSLTKYVHKYRHTKAYTLY